MRIPLRRASFGVVIGAALLNPKQETSNFHRLEASRRARTHFKNPLVARAHIHNLANTSTELKIIRFTSNMTTILFVSIIYTRVLLRRCWSTALTWNHRRQEATNLWLDDNVSSSSKHCDRSSSRRWCDGGIFYFETGVGERGKKKSGSRIVITFYNPLFPVSNAGAAALEPPLLWRLYCKGASTVASEENRWSLAYIKGSKMFSVEERRKEKGGYGFFTTLVAAPVLLGDPP